MAKITRQKAISILFLVAPEYQEKLADRMFRLIYDDRSSHSIKVTDVVFRPEHFKHLTGIQTNIKSWRFYDACIKQRLSPKDISIDDKGKAQRKLEVIGGMVNLFYRPCWIGVSLNNDIYIHADYYVGDTQCVLSVGFRGTKDGDVPVTLKKQSIREVVTKECKVYAIASKSLLDKNSAWQLTYCARDFDPAPWITDGR